MAARLRRVNYDEMNAIVKSFRTEQQEIEALYKQTKSKVDALHNNQWVGQGSEKWFRRNGRPGIACRAETDTRPGLRW